MSFRPRELVSVITDFLLDHRDLVPPGLGVVAIACLGIGYVLTRGDRDGRRVTWALSLLALLAVLALTLAPSPGPHLGPATCTVQIDYPTLGRVELIANVAVFFPLAYFATLATRRPVLTLAVLAAASAGIEITQALVPALGRACDTNDWLMNTIGASAGVVLAAATVAVADRIDSRRSGQAGHTRD